MVGRINVKDPMGDRMKRYEAATRAVLPRRTYTVIRVDGRSFHSYLRHARKPFDYEFMGHMQDVALKLVEEIQGSVFAYQQSDEISVLLTDFDSITSEPWFGGVIQKVVSVSASIATAALGSRRQTLTGTPLFDSRVFTIPDPVEVANYFIWRQRDAIRNSVTMVAQAHFSPRELHKVSIEKRREKLWEEKGIDWNDFPERAKRGSVISRRYYGEWGLWEAEAAPYFKAEPGSWLAKVIPALPSLEEK